MAIISLPCSETECAFDVTTIDSISRTSRYCDYKCFLWMDAAHSPYTNMARDEQIFTECSRLQSPLVRFYGWNRPSVSIGYFQRYNSVPSFGFSVVRRPTGGGIVIHGDDITYSIATPSTHWFYKISRQESYRTISGVIIKSLSQCGIKAFLSDTHRSFNSALEQGGKMCFNNPVKFDVLVGHNKVAGAAQKRNQYGLLHQGSISISDLQQFDREQFTCCLITELQHLFACKLTLYEPREEFSNRADILAQNKYCTTEWNKKR